MSVSDRIRRAFAASDTGYLGSCLLQRNPGASAAGSRFLSTLSLDDLQGAAWEEYSHGAVKAPAVAFKAPIRGRFGLIRLSDLSPEAMVTLRDPKNTGNVEAVTEGVLGPEVDFTVLLLGPSRESGEEVVWTFFPGEPIMPSSVKTEEYGDGTKVSVANALALGLEWAKVG